MIELAPGTFTGAGNRDVQVPARSLAIRSQSGDPTTCVIDCESAGRTFHFLAPAAGQALDGVTIIGGVAADGGGALRLNAGVAVSHCVFLRNRAQSGGAVSTSGQATSFVRCRFIENTAAAGGAFSTGTMSPQQASPVFDSCEFIGNSADYGGGAVLLEALPIRDATFRGSTFANNSAQVGGALLLYGFSPIIEGCTFAYNAAPGGGVIQCEFSVMFPADPTFSNTIIAFSTSGAAVACSPGSQAALLCSDVYGNTGGDWVGCIEGQAGQDGNISADPLFCGPEDGDYTIASGSPCAPENQPDCGLIGAWPVGCGGPVPAARTTWGRIKSGLLR